MAVPDCGAGMAAIFVSWRAHGFVVGMEVDAAQPRALFFLWALQDCDAIPVMDGDPKSCEDGCAISVTEGTYAEKIVGKGRHDVAEVEFIGG